MLWTFLAEIPGPVLRGYLVSAFRWGMPWTELFRGGSVSCQRFAGEEEINRKLVVAVGQEAVCSHRKNAKTGRQSRFQFAHDRFQQVFYTVLSPKKGCRFTIRLQNDMRSRAVLEGGIWMNGCLKLRIIMPRG